MRNLRNCRRKREGEAQHEWGKPESTPIKSGGSLNNPAKSGSSTLRIWNVSAAVVVLALALAPVIQDSFHRAYESGGVPVDFPHYFIAGRLARLRPPENLLYYPPAGHTARSYFDLRIDATTPYGRAPLAGGLPDGAVTLPFDAPPFAALLMEPLTFLSWKMAYLVWQLVCTLLMMASVYFALCLFQVHRPPLVAVAIGCAMAFLSPCSITRDRNREGGTSSRW